MDADIADQVVEAGDIEVMAGTSSADLPLTEHFAITTTLELEHRRSFTTPTRLA